MVGVIPVIEDIRPVWVLHDDQWIEGWLEATRLDGGSWRGFVRYTVAAGSTYLQWRPDRELRRWEHARPEAGGGA